MCFHSSNPGWKRKVWRRRKQTPLKGNSEGFSPLTITNPPVTAVGDWPDVSAANAVVAVCISSNLLLRATARVYHLWHGKPLQATAMHWQLAAQLLELLSCDSPASAGCETCNGNERGAVTLS